LIHFNITAKTAFKRLKERPKVTTGQRNAEADELLNIINAQIDIARIAADVIKLRGVKVLELNSELPIKQKVDYINKFIADLNV